ncbi:MAG: hypothetical protein GY696_16635, partial [Gammaproteobacteria bacterium]|nr:hypothetical protein [Gammaproteobacteria bacterium]
MACTRLSAASRTEHHPAASQAKQAPSVGPCFHCDKPVKQIDAFSWVAVGCSCQKCGHWYHFTCLEKSHTWKGDRIALPPNFFKFLEIFHSDEHDQGYSFVCSKCDPNMPPLLMQLWLANDLTLDEACALKVYKGPLEHFHRAQKSLNISHTDQMESMRQMIMEMNSQMMKEQRASLAEEREMREKERAESAKRRQEEREEHTKLIATFLKGEKFPL